MSTRLKWGDAKSAAIAAQAQGLTATTAARQFGVKVNSIYRAALRCGFRFVSPNAPAVYRHARRTI